MLLGPKGVGKTTLGALLAREPGVFFVDVEPIAKQVLEAIGGTISEEYARRAFDAIVEAVGARSGAHRVIVIETTGASDATGRLLEGLRAEHEVRLVRVRARAETCRARIDARDASRQIAVPPELVEEMHRRTEALSLAWDLEVDNDPALSADEVRRVFAPLLR